MFDYECDFDINANQGRHWVWDNQSNTLCLVEPHSEKQRQRGTTTSASSLLSPVVLEQNKIECKTKFLEAIEPVEQVKFRRHFMRKTKQNELDVIILQDVKDVVFHLLLSPVPIDFIKFFHTPEVDNFLRALILYFQYYLEIWEDVEYRKKFSSQRLKHPVGEEKEKIVGEYLNQLRCIIARDYSLLLLASGSCKTFHHMANSERKSISEKDLKLFEHLFVLSTQVVWIALNRQSFAIIELELHRLFRSDHFNFINQKRKSIETQDPEKNSSAKVLTGIRNKERKLFVRSPAIHEITIGTEHSYELLQLGMVPINSINEGLMHLQQAYTEIEEYLESNEICVGILGHSRDSYEPLLQPKEQLIGSVKKYKISSGLPGIFLMRLTTEESQANKDPERISQTDSSKTFDKEQFGEKEVDEEVQIIIRPREYYEKLHRLRNVKAKNMWLKYRSIAGINTNHTIKHSLTRKISINLQN